MHFARGGRRPAHLLNLAAEGQDAVGAVGGELLERASCREAESARAEALVEGVGDGNSLEEIGQSPDCVLEKLLRSRRQVGEPDLLLAVTGVVCYGALQLGKGRGKG
jgi:hypothetical protein